MKKHVLTHCSILALLSAVSAFAGVTVSSPINGSTINRKRLLQSLGVHLLRERRSFHGNLPGPISVGVRAQWIHSEHDS